MQAAHWTLYTRSFSGNENKMETAIRSMTVNCERYASRSKMRRQAI
jgi:hypothetical protein